MKNIKGGGTGVHVLTELLDLPVAMRQQALTPKKS